MIGAVLAVVSWLLARGVGWGVLMMRVAMDALGSWCGMLGPRVSVGVRVKGGSVSGAQGCSGEACLKVGSLSFLRGPRVSAGVRLKCCLVYPHDAADDFRRGSIDRLGGKLCSGLLW